VNPTVSLITTVRDREQFLPAALDSALAQTFTDFELVDLDDGSRDRSAEIARADAARDARIRVISTEPRGRVAALNAAMQASRAPL